MTMWTSCRINQLIIYSEGNAVTTLSRHNWSWHSQRHPLSWSSSAQNSTCIFTLWRVIVLTICSYRHCVTSLLKAVGTPIDRLEFVLGSSYQYVVSQRYPVQECHEPLDFANVPQTHPRVQHGHVPSSLCRELARRQEGWVSDPWICSFQGRPPMPSTNRDCLFLSSVWCIEPRLNTNR